MTEENDALCGVYALVPNRIVDFWPDANCPRCLAKMILDGAITPVVDLTEYAKRHGGE